MDETLEEHAERFDGMAAERTHDQVGVLVGERRTESDT